MFWQYIIDGLTLGSLYGILAISYALIFGVIRIINFAQGELITIGSFGALGMALLLINTNHGNSLSPSGVPIFIVIPLMIISGIIVTVIAGVLMEYLMFKPLLRRDAPPLLGLIVSLGVSIFLQNIMRITISTSDVTFPMLIRAHPLTLGKIQISPIQIIIIIVCFCLSIISYIFVEKTKIGLSILAVRDNKELAESVGISVKMVLDAIFITASIVAAIGGILMGFYYGVARFDMGFLPGIKGFTASIMGGVGNVRGAMISGVILGIIESLGAAYIASGYKDAFAFILLVVVLLFRPSGLLGKKD